MFGPLRQTSDLLSHQPPPVAGHGDPSELWHGLHKHYRPVSLGGRFDCLDLEFGHQLHLISMITLIFFLPILDFMVRNSYSRINPYCRSILAPRQLYPSPQFFLSPLCFMPCIVPLERAAAQEDSTILVVHTPAEEVVELDRSPDTSETRVVAEADDSGIPIDSGHGRHMSISVPCRLCR